MREFRPTTPADVPALLELFAAAGLKPNARRQDLEWKYWQVRTDWPGPRSFVLTEGDALLAHGAIVPGVCTWDSRRLEVIHLIDWAARPSALGAGTALLNHIGQQAQALIAIGGSAATRRLLPHLGFGPRGVVTGWVRALHPTRLRGHAGAPRWRLWPRLARGLAWKLAAPSPPDGPWRARRLAPEEIAQLAGVLPKPVREAALLERSVALLRYALACPVVPVALYALENAGRVRGYFVLASAPGQVRLADFWIESSDAADWRAAILCAVGVARQDPQAAELVTWASDARFEAALHSCGFHARFRNPVLMRAGDPGALPAAALRVQMLDCDAAFLHEERSEFWA